MKNKMSTILCIGVVCILLSGCGAENSSQGERDTEQSVQNQTVVENQSQDTKIEAGKYADGYPRGELITEQTFDLNLEPLGEVTFASYLPDDCENHCWAFVPVCDGSIHIRLIRSLLHSLLMYMQQRLLWLL